MTKTSQKPALPGMSSVLLSMFSVSILLPAINATAGEIESECAAGELGLLRAPLEQTGERFGSGMCAYGDIVAIAASGRIYTYRNMGELLPDTVLEPEVGLRTVECGQRVVVATDHWSRVHFFSQTDSGWVESSFSTQDQRVEDMEFLSDGRVAIGSPKYGGGEVGAVLLFAREGDIWRQTGLIRPPVAYEGETFGLALAAAGEKLAVGSARALYIYGTDGNEFVLDQKTPLVELNTFDLISIDVVANDAQIIVYFNQYFRYGILVFERAGTGWEVVQEIDDYGNLALAGSWLAAAKPWFPDPSRRFGKVNLYRLDETGWRLVDQIRRNGEQVLDEFGTSVSFLADRLLIGVPGFDAEQYGVGAVVERILAADCNHSARSDTCDIQDGASEDCNSNGIPDECEPNEDCNANGLQDICDAPVGAAEDCDGDGVPDECIGPNDCDADAMPDACAITNGSADCQDNGVPDSCDIASRNSLDVNGDLIPDECQPDLCLEPVCLEGPCAWLKAVAINGKPIPPASCVRAAAGSVLDVELWWSDWATALPGGADVYQMTLNAPKSAISGTSGTVLPLGFKEPLQPIFCSEEYPCPAEYPVCTAASCEAMGHAPGLGLALDATRPDFIFADVMVWVADYSTQLAWLTYFAVADLECLDPGVPAYAGSLKLLVSEDACGIFRYEFDDEELSGMTYLVGDDDQPPVKRLPLTIVAPVCDCNGDGVFDWQAIRTGISKDCNRNQRPDDCDIADGAPDANNDGIPDYCKRVLPRDLSK